MNELEDFEEESSGTIFRDVIMLALIGFVAMVIMLLPHLAETKEQSEEHRSPGNVVVEIQRHRLRGEAWTNRQLTARSAPVPSRR